MNSNQQQQWNSFTNNLFPPLTPSSHKGSHGRIAIFGGSEKYAGAPYYAAQSALHAGIDLATVFCAKEASVPIKCYSPELMVQGVYSVEELDTLLDQERGLLEALEQCKQSNDLMTNEMNEMDMLQTMEKLEHSKEKQNILIQSELKKDDQMELLVERLEKMKHLEEELQILRKRQQVSVASIVHTITSTFPTLHALCIGPGLGRHPLVFSAAEKVIRKAIESNLTLVLDADALFMLSLKEYRSLLGEIRGYDRCVMTPNLMETRRLDEATSKEMEAGESVAEYGNIVVQKGHTDTITHGCHTMQCKEEGGLKRSGGIGDVLAGTITAFMAWNAILEKDNTPNGNIDGKAVNRQHIQRVFASWAACCAVKRGTRIAFQKQRRAMSALDVSGEIGEVLGSMEGGLELELCSDQVQTLANDMPDAST
eukprot:CAMPEP_0201667866 /NCGR_PEP_ID=MMETSP0494-20130426/17134_1 /ASSEMBLY_ACC=CAM_ASM_000839 /TAXON_ID=420259 /ORGANISM="Thalassiosira gravida, Strain GMp14c1" /LENGTH=424 /DNA_ID=CAMNT_0048148025 /DNA_START=195 /DNA_END=1469 /DNA_ORIENTATION=-